MPRRAWTLPPIGFRMNDATTSDEIAADGVTPKKITRIGVISAPPPMPVRPMIKPTMRPAAAMSSCMASLPRSWTVVD